MGGVKKCAVCKRSEKIPGVKLFSFPRQKYRCDQWLQNIGNPELFKFSTYRLSVAYKVCEQHFERNCFFSDMLNRLARDAVPTLFGLNVKRHVAIDGAVLKHQQNKCPTEKFQKLSALCHEGGDCDKVSGRMPGNTTPVLGLENFTDSKLPQEHMTCTDNTLNKNDEFNFCVNEIPQHDFHQLSVLSVRPSRLEDANNKQINTQEKVSFQIDKMCESESKELVPSTEAHLANTCRTENSSSPISDGDGVSVEHFLHSWIVECDLNENENSSTLFGGIGERVNDKKECEHDIGEATMSFSEVSETVGGAEGDLEQEQFSDYMDVGSMNGLDQSDFLHSWMPGSSIVSNKGHVSNDRIDEQQCALSDIAIGLMAEGTEHEKISAVKDITVCNWANEKVFSGLPKLSHDDYDELSVCEQDSSEPAHFGSISLLGLCGEEHPVVSPGNRVGSSDELPLCDSLPTETSCENVFSCQKFVSKKLSGLTNSSKENFPKAISSADINFLPVEFSFNKDFPTIQLVQPDSVKLSDKLCQVTYTSDGIAVTEANLNPTSHSCNVSKLSQGSDLSQNISCTDQVNSKENVNTFMPPKSVTLNVSDSKEASDSTNYVVCSFESICRLCLAEDQVMYPIFSDSNSVTDKDVVSCIPVKVQKDDRYPKMICEKCYDQMACWHKFKEVCFKSQSVLEQLSIGTRNECTNTEKQEKNICISLPSESIKEELKVSSRSTQTVPIVDLIIGEEPLINEPGMVPQNKEHDLICHKIKQRQLTLLKKKPPSEMKVRKAREIISRKRNIKKAQNCVGREPSSSTSSSTSACDGARQNKVVNVMKHLHFSGLKPGCRLTVADKRYLIVGTKSASKTGIGLYTKPDFSTETDFKHRHEIELPT